MEDTRYTHYASLMFKLYPNLVKRVETNQKNSSKEVPDYRFAIMHGIKAVFPWTPTPEKFDFWKNLSKTIDDAIKEDFTDIFFLSKVLQVCIDQPKDIIPSIETAEMASRLYDYTVKNCNEKEKTIEQFEILIKTRLCRDILNESNR